MTSRKDAIRAEIIALREQMEHITDKDYQTSADWAIYKNLSARCDSLIKELFTK